MILGYVRVSSLDQAGPDKTSMDSQETTIHGFAQMRGHTKFDVQIFRDAGVSGAMKFKSRPGGDDLMKIVKPGAVLFFFLVAAPLCTGAFLLLRHFFEGKQS